MVDPIGLVANWAGAGMGAGGGFFMIKWVVEYIGGRVDKRQAAVDVATQHLIDNMQTQLDSLISRVGHLEEELEKCRRESADHRAEAVELRAFLRGSGDAKQLAQLILSKERLQDKGEGA